MLLCKPLSTPRSATGLPSSRGGGGVALPGHLPALGGAAARRCGGRRSGGRAPKGIAPERWARTPWLAAPAVSESAEERQMLGAPGYVDVLRGGGQRPRSNLYSEESRKYRRTVYSNDDWLEHRSSTRLFGNLMGTFTSGVVRSLGTEVAAVTMVAAGVVLWNSIMGGYADFSGAPHPGVLGASPLADSLLMRLPALPFTLSSSALGLLLVFRTNASYARWLDARMQWGRVVSHCRNVQRQASAWAIPGEGTKRALDDLAQCTWVFSRTLQAHLAGPEEGCVLREDLVLELGEDRAEEVLSAGNRPLRALADLSRSMEALPLDDKRKTEMDKSIIILGDALEACERIFTSPVPLVYTRHTARFLSAWLLLLPLAMWGPFESSWNHFALIPATTLIAIFLFGIEELSVQLEEPFSILPLKELCDGVRSAAADLAPL